MTDDFFHYDKLVADALRGVVRTVLSQVVTTGLSGRHHFYITFRTDFPGVSIPESLRQRHPEEMTIVLQHQFWDLTVTEIGFGVTLSFNRVSERLEIPFAAITAFADPSAQFLVPLQVEMPPSRQKKESASVKAVGSAPLDASKKQATPSAEKKEEKSEKVEKADDAVKSGAEEKGNVVTLDAFRKK